MSTKKIVISAAVIFAFLFYALQQKTDSPALISPVPAASQNYQASQNDYRSTPTPTPTPAFQMGPQNMGGGANTGMGMMAKGYKDGEYVGQVVDAFYGNIQVNAVISGGKITDVQFLQYPNDRRTSQEINTIAMPMLKQEAISAQSANVDIVSGATQSSMAFQQSLSSALSQAL